MVPADSRRVPRAPRYSGCQWAPSGFAYRTLTVYGRTFQTRSAHPKGATTWSYYPGGAQKHAPRFGLFPGRSPLLGESLLFSFPAGTKMFQFPALASAQKVPMAGLQPAGLSHSDTRGSKVICTYPRLIAAYRVLRRLREPRHPPCAFRNFHRCATLKKSKARSYFQLCRTPANIVRGTTLIRVLFSTVSLCRNMSKIVWEYSQSGEYRGRTDDLLHAMQAL